LLGCQDGRAKNQQRKKNNVPPMQNDLQAEIATNVENFASILIVEKTGKGFPHEIGRTEMDEPA
jgi:hypothetical protein